MYVDLEKKSCDFRKNLVRVLVALFKVTTNDIYYMLAKDALVSDSEKGHFHKIRVESDTRAVTVEGVKLRDENIRVMFPAILFDMEAETLLNYISALDKVCENVKEICYLFDDSSEDSKSRISELEEEIRLVMKGLTYKDPLDVLNEFCIYRALRNLRKYSIVHNS